MLKQFTSRTSSALAFLILVTVAGAIYLGLGPIEQPLAAGIVIAVGGLIYWWLK